MKKTKNNIDSIDRCGDPLGWYDPMEDYYCYMEKGHKGRHVTLVPYRYPLMEDKIIPTKIAWK